MLKEAMSEIRRIASDPGRCGGRPCSRGLRIRAKDIRALAAAGAAREEIPADPPDPEAEDVTAAPELAVDRCH